MPWLFGKPSKTPPKPLAHCPDRSPGTLRLEPQGVTVPVVVLLADGTGITVETMHKGTPGNTVIGEYRIGEVAFAFRGVVQEVLGFRDGKFHWQIRFVLSL